MGQFDVPGGVDRPTSAARFSTVAIMDTGGDHSYTFQASGNEGANRTITVPLVSGNRTLAFTDHAQTFTVDQTFSGWVTVSSGNLRVKDTGGDHAISFAAGADEAANRTLTIPALGGNDTLMTLGTAQTITGEKTLTQTLYHSGSFTFSSVNSGPMVTWSHTGGSQYMILGYNYLTLKTTDGLLLGEYPTGAIIQKGSNNGVSRFTGFTDGAQIEIEQCADIGTPATNSVRFGGEDVAGTTEAIAADEAGNETQLTPHAADGPPEVYDEDPGIEHVVRSINRFTGRVEWLNMTRAALCAETGERKKCRFVETLADYNARTGKNKTLLKWEEVQAANQAAYDAAREREIALKTQAEEFAVLDALAAEQQHAEAIAEYSKLPAEEKAATPAPVKRDVPQPQFVEPRPAADIRKPIPAHIAKIIAGVK